MKNYVAICGLHYVGICGLRFPFTFYYIADVPCVFELLRLRN